MANEIQVSAALSVTKNSATISGSQTVTDDMSGDELIGSIQSIGTADTETINLGDVSTLGWLYLRNTDSTNTITVSLDEPGAQIVSVLQAGDFCLLKQPPTTLYAQAANSACLLHVVACER